MTYLGDDGANWRTAAVAGKHAEAGPLVQEVPMQQSCHVIRDANVRDANLTCQMCQMRMHARGRAQVKRTCR